MHVHSTYLQALISIKQTHQHLAYLHTTSLISGRIQLVVELGAWYQVSYPSVYHLLQDTDSTDTWTVWLLSL